MVVLDNYIPADYTVRSSSPISTFMSNSCLFIYHNTWIIVLQN